MEERICPAIIWVNTLEDIDNDNYPVTMSLREAMNHPNLANGDQIQFLGDIGQLGNEIV